MISATEFVVLCYLAISTVLEFILMTNFPDNTPLWVVAPTVTGSIVIHVQIFRAVMRTLRTEPSS